MQVLANTALTCCQQRAEITLTDLFEEREVDHSRDEGSSIRNAAEGLPDGVMRTLSAGRSTRSSLSFDSSTGLAPNGIGLHQQKG